MAATADRTFFPQAWDQQRVVDKINEAYANRIHLRGARYEGLTSEGIRIRLFLDADGFICTAFPVQELS